jgi:tRNA (mo5U34)-methyltransferase
VNLAERVARVNWYHTMELPGGIVTPGRYDTRAVPRRLPFPASLTGMRCLDVGTADGFWAFEMERRDAHEVVALEVSHAGSWDWPAPGPSGTHRRNGPDNAERAFSIAAEALRARARPVEMTVYDLSPGRVGQFDFVFVGSLLLHLRDPVGALTAIRSVTRGELLSADSVSIWMSLAAPRFAAASLRAVGDPTWWTPNVAGHRRLLRAAGFEVIEGGGIFFIPAGAGYERIRFQREALHPHRLALRIGMKLLGAPSTWARAIPAPSGTA